MSNPISNLIVASQYVPSNRAIRARNEFWAQSGIQVPPEQDKASTLALAPQKWISQLMEKQWDTPGFLSWFLSPQWEKEESQRLLHLAMGRLSEILIEEEETSIVLSAAKEAREVYTKLNGNQTVRYADEQVAEMSKEELEEFLRRNAKLLDSITTSK